MMRFMRDATAITHVATRCRAESVARACRISSGVYEPIDQSLGVWHYKIEDIFPGYIEELVARVSYRVPQLWALSPPSVHFHGVFFCLGPPFLVWSLDDP